MARQRAWETGTVRYIACSALALLWYKKLTHPLDVPQAALFLAGVAAGMIVAAVICDRIRPRHPQTVAAIAALLAAAATPATIVDPRWLPVAGFCGAVAFLLLQYRGLRSLPAGVRCTSFALVFACAGAINTLTSLAELPTLRVETPPGSAWYATVVMAAAAALIYAARRAPAPVAERPEPGRRWMAVAALSVLAATLAYAVFAVSDHPAYPAALATSSPTGWIRLVEVPLFVAVGLICDRFGSWAVMIASLCAGLLGAAGPLVPSSGSIRLLLLGCSFASILAFCVAMIGLLAEYSLRARRAGALCAIGLLPVVAGQAIAVPVHALAAQADPLHLFALGFVPSVLLVPIVIVLLDQLRTRSTPELKEPAGSPAMDHAESSASFIAPPFAERWGLTRRETEVFDLVLEELTVSEMAQALFVTTSTVKQHVGHILKKSGTESRAELLADVREEWPGAPAPRGAQASADPRDEAWTRSGTP